MPLTFDLSYEALLVYRGTNPKPVDFDEFWQAGLEEMRSINSQVELIPAEFQASSCDCFDMYFTGVGGARIHAKLLRPSAFSQLHPAVLMFHGYRGNSGDWVSKLPYVYQGFTVAALDCRGQGGKSVDTSQVSGNTLNGHIIRGLGDAINGAPEKLLYRQIFLDTAQLAKIVMAMEGVDPNKVGAMGASQGGALAIACASLEPRIRKAVATYPFLSDYKRVWEMDQAKDAYNGLKEYFRLFDPLHEKEESAFECLGYIDIQNLADRIQADVLWGIGLMDTICPPSSQFATYNKIASSKDMVIYPDFSHELLPGFNDLSFQFMLSMLT